MDPNGVMVQGWYETNDGKVRFFDEGGAMVRGLNLIDDRYYYFGENGALERAEITVDGQKREIPETGADNWGGAAAA